MRNIQKVKESFLKIDKPDALVIACFTYKLPEAFNVGHV